MSCHQGLCLRVSHQLGHGGKASVGLTQAWMLRPGSRWVPSRVQILSAAFAVQGIPVDTPSSTTTDLKLPPMPCPAPPGLRYLQWPQKSGTLCGCHPPCLASSASYHGGHLVSPASHPTTLKGGTSCSPRGPPPLSPPPQVFSFLFFPPFLFPFSLKQQNFTLSPPRRQPSEWRCGHTPTEALGGPRSCLPTAARAASPRPEVFKVHSFHLVRPLSSSEGQQHASCDGGGHRDLRHDAGSLGLDLRLVLGCNIVSASVWDALHPETTLKN